MYKIHFDITNKYHLDPTVIFKRSSNNTLRLTILEILNATHNLQIFKCICTNQQLLFNYINVHFYLLFGIEEIYKYL